MLLRKNKKIVMKKFLKGKLDEITAIFQNIVDKSLEITDKKFGMFDILSKKFNYCSMHEDGFKPEIFLLSMISAKSKKMFAITDVPMALTCPYALEKFRLAIKSDEDIMTEGNVRNLINKDENYVYIVILSTDTKMNEVNIIRMYEQRTEIEEDFRQIKDQWDLATFTSTKYNYIMCHIAMLLLGYNIYSLFKGTEEGIEYINKSMKALEKKVLC